MLARVRDLEARKAQLAASMVDDPPPEIVPNVEQAIRQRVRELERLPRDPRADDDVRQRARQAIRGLLGGDVVRIVEDGEAVYAEVDLGRWYITGGAQERT